MPPPQMIDRLLQLKEEYPLNENYNWNLPTGPIPIPGFVIPQDHDTPYQRNIFLKENLQQYFVPDMTLELHYWVIRDWGRIRRFGKTATGENHVNNQQRITDFGMELNEGTLTRASFQVLPSLSKVASFQFPDRYAIYDSRSIFSLNWLIFRHWPDHPLFPQPPSRNTAIRNCDTTNLFAPRLPPLERFGAYHYYCEMLRELSSEIYGDNRPFKMEMLLFVVADTAIVNEIRNF